MCSQVAILGKKGRKLGDQPIEIVLNEAGGRKTPSGIAFAKGERLNGVQLGTARSRFPKVRNRSIMNVSDSSFPQCLCLARQSVRNPAVPDQVLGRSPPYAEISSLIDNMVRLFADKILFLRRRWFDILAGYFHAPLGHGWQAER